MEMTIKHVTMTCPDCGEIMKYSIGCIGTPNNEFDVIELEHTEFHCSPCRKIFFIGDINYFSE